MEFNFQGDIVDSYYEPDQIMRKKIDGISSVRTISICDGELFFNYPLCDTIYKIKNRQLIPAFYIDFSSKKIPDNLFEKQFNGVREMMKEIQAIQGVGMMPFYGITRHFIHFSFDDFEYNGYIAFYDIKNNKTLVGHHIIDDMYFTGNKVSLKSWHLPKSMAGEDLIWHIQPSVFKEWYDNYKSRSTEKEWDLFNSKYQHITAIYDNLKEDNNPILLKMKISL